VIVLALGLIVSMAVIVVLTYLLGFRLGGESWIAQAHRVRSQAAQAERELHDLTRPSDVVVPGEVDVKRMAETLGLVLLVCIGVRIGAELIEPVLPLLGGGVVAIVVGMWLVGRNGPGGGYR
jgi:hypothetical protein